MTTMIDVYELQDLFIAYIRRVMKGEKYELPRLIIEVQYNEDNDQLKDDKTLGWGMCFHGNI